MADEDCDCDWLMGIIDPSDATVAYCSDQDGCDEEPFLFDRSEDENEDEDSLFDLTNNSCTESSDGDWSEDDISSKLAFLKKKRALLKRASDFMKQEELYEATIADRNEEDKPAPIWKEAHEVLSVLNRRNTAAYGRNKSVSFTPQSWQKKRQARAILRGRRSRISTGEVGRINSKDFEINAMGHTKSTTADTEPELIEALGKMQTESTFPSCIDSRIDPVASSNDTAVPTLSLGSGSPSDAGMPLEDALIITDVPQLIAQATAPFTVIHANKSFMAFARMPFSEVFARSMEELVKTEKGMLSAAWQEDSAKLAQIGGSFCEIKLSPVAGSYLLVQVTKQNVQIQDGVLAPNLDHMVATFG